jgi:hypothetical protein
MILVDMILKPADNYWKKQYNAERIRRQRAEADAKCYKDEADYTNDSLAILTERDLKQARAIEAYSKEVENLKRRVDLEHEKVLAKEREIELLSQALRAEREAKEQYRTSQRLWEAGKSAMKEAQA